MLGQLFNVPNAMGFQYSYMVMGAVAAVCLFYIFKKIFPKKKDYVSAIAAFIVSIHPIFLACLQLYIWNILSCVVYICIVRISYTKYVLMFFWLIMLGTCKETGAMMAFSMLFLLSYMRLQRMLRRVVE